MNINQIEYSVTQNVILELINSLSQYKMMALQILKP